MRGGDAKGSLLAVLDATLTPMGSRLLRRWINQPLLDVDAINRRLDAVQCCVDDTVLRLEVRELLGQIGDLERWTNRVLQGSGLPARPGGHARGAAPSFPRLRRLPGQLDPAAVAILPALPACAAVLALLEAAFADDPPATLATPGIIRPGFDAELDGLVEKSRHAKDWIANLEQVERQRLDIKSLKVGYNKVFGYYIEVTNTPRWPRRRPSTFASRRSPTASATSRLNSRSTRRWCSTPTSGGWRSSSTCLARSAARSARMACSSCSWRRRWQNWTSTRRWPRWRCCAAMCARQWTRGRPSRSKPAAILWWNWR